MLSRAHLPGVRGRGPNMSRCFCREPRKYTSLKPVLLHSNVRQRIEKLLQWDTCHGRLAVVDAASDQNSPSVLGITRDGADKLDELAFVFATRCCSAAGGMQNAGRFLAS